MMPRELLEVNIWLDVCGVLIILLILFLHYLRHTLPLMQNRLYILILISVGCGCLTSIISILTPSRVELSVLMNELTVFFGVAVGALWVGYMCILVNVGAAFRRWWRALFIPLIGVGIGMMLNHFFPVFFEVGQDGIIRHGPLYILLIGVYGLYFLGGILLVVFSGNYLSRERKLLFIPFVLIGVTGGLTDVFFPEWRTIRYALVLCILLYYFSLQNPDEYYDEDSPLFNAYAFEQLFRTRLDDGMRMHCIAIYIRQLEYMAAVFDKDELYDIQKQGLTILKSRARQCMLFRYSRGRYLVVVMNERESYAKKVYTDIRVTLDEIAKQLAGTLPFTISTLAFESPKDVYSPAGIDNLIRHFCQEADRTKKDELVMDELGIRSEREEKELEKEIRDALAEKRMEVYYQPIYAPGEKKFTSAEALIRMRDREGNFVSPGLFIPAAERNGLVLEISDFVLDEVAKTMSSGRLWEQGMEYIEVNLSVTECLQKDLVPRIMGTLERYDLDPKRINLEITETASDTFSSTLDENIETLHERGLEFSLDDFGTGYSSLNRLLELPLNLIKLDITLVRPAFEPGNDKAYALLECAVDIAKGVGMSMVAEGVETREVAEGIIALGVDHIQGYYYSKPLPKQEFLNLVAAQ